MRKLHIYCCLLSVLCGVDAEITVQGREGDNVSFTCSHSNAWFNKKYLCRSPCKDADVIVQVEAGETSTKDRLILNESGNGTFKVTFHQLQMSDEGLYHCGVDRWIKDTYINVQLTVLKAPTTSTVTPPPTVSMVTPGFTIASTPPGPPTTTIPTVSPSSPTTEISLTTKAPGQGIVLYFSVVLVVFVIVVGAALVYYRKWRGRNRKSPESSGPELHLDNITAGQVERVDENLRVEERNTDFLNPIYSLHLDNITAGQVERAYEILTVEERTDNVI